MKGWLGRQFSSERSGEGWVRGGPSLGVVYLYFSFSIFFLFFPDKVTFLVFSRGLLGRLRCEKGPRAYSEAFARKISCLGYGVRDLFSYASFASCFLFVLCFCGRFVCLGRYGNRFVGRFGAQAMIFLRYLADTAGFRLFLSKA